MKKQFTTLLVIMSMASSAGVLENKRTGESISFDLLENEGVLRVISRTHLVQSHERLLKEFRPKESNIEIFAGSNYANEVYEDNGVEIHAGSIVATALIPVGNIPRVAGFAYDLVTLPIKGPLKIIQNMKFKGDLRKLQKSIASVKTIRVSNKRFIRISQLLKKSN